MTKALIVRFTLRPGSAEAFDDLVRSTVDAIRLHEPGTLVYAVHEVPDRPDERLFYELYADDQAFEQHEAQPHTRRFLADREQHLLSVSVDVARTITTAGVPTLETP